MCLILTNAFNSNIYIYLCIYMHLKKFMKNVSKRKIYFDARKCNIHTFKRSFKSSWKKYML